MPPVLCQTVKSDCLLILLQEGFIITLGNKINLRLQKVTIKGRMWGEVWVFAIGFCSCLLDSRGILRIKAVYVMSNSETKCERKLTKDLFSSYLYLSSFCLGLLPACSPCPHPMLLLLVLGSSALIFFSIFTSTFPHFALFSYLLIFRPVLSFPCSKDMEHMQH